MPKFSIVLSRKAEKQLDKLSTSVVSQIIESFSILENNPRPNGYKKLKGRQGYRIRSGNYRIIYEIFENELLIDVIAIGHRKDIYQ